VIAKMTGVSCNDAILARDACKVEMEAARAAHKLAVEAGVAARDAARAAFRTLLNAERVCVDAGTMVGNKRCPPAVATAQYAAALAVYNDIIGAKSDVDTFRRTAADNYYKAYTAHAEANDRV
jgi:hypothetical protein